MGEWGPTATQRTRDTPCREPSRWGNGGQPQPEPAPRGRGRSLADGGMGANRNGVHVLVPLQGSLADGGMGANRNALSVTATPV